MFPQPGEPFLSNHFRPLLWFEEDSSPGVHDMFFSACSPALYAALGHEAPHPNCRDNFFAAAAQEGWTPAVEPDPVNIFQNTPVDAAGVLTSLPALTQPGDDVVLRAEIDLIVVVTACSMDLKPITGGSAPACGSRSPGTDWIRADVARTEVNRDLASLAGGHPVGR